MLLLGSVRISVSYPEAGRFNIRGGVEILPEFVALLFGLVTYTAGFIAEVVRAGILAVSKGQSEAANALGLRTGPRFVLSSIPQAMRVIIPPLTSQYLNLTKNSSLAVAIGYPDLVQVFTGTVLNQTGQAVEVVVITMAVYLTISLVTSIGDELVQFAHGDRGTVGRASCRSQPSSRWIRNIRSPMCAMFRSRRCRRRWRRAGRIGWLRANFFATPFDVVLSVAMILLVLWIVPPLVEIHDLRRGLVRKRPRGLSGDAAASGSRRLLGLCARALRLFHVRLLPDLRAVAGRYFLRHAGDRRVLAVALERAAP